ncbi:uncharacterized protein LOC110989354 [Acanthaster planci]|uniref:Uncharacterized protein LOC110989354 n=1 Tax=Acanthaster planci TaxID=133434 RepID=A0A8B7ZVC9_ACAPL|nr:uncharacterized protein LOC110989354 [Acanthaster planci]
MPRYGDPTTYYGICSDVPVTAPKGPLCDEELLRIASSLSNDWRMVAQSLGLPDNRIGSIERGFPPKERLFAVLRDWRGKSLKMNAPHETAVDLANAMFELGRDDIGHHLVKKYQDAFECS